MCTTTFCTLFRLKFDWLKKLSCKNDLGDQLNEPTKIKMGKNEESFCGAHSIIREFSMGCIIIKKNGHKGVLYMSNCLCGYKDESEIIFFFRCFH